MDNSISLTPAIDIVRRVYSRVYSPRSQLAPADWMAENIVLSAKESIDHSGPYNPDLCPYHRIIYEAFFNPDYKEIVIRKSSQAGVTLAALALITYIAAERPANLLYVLDSRDEMRKVAQVRLIPMLESCAATGADYRESEERERASSAMIELPEMVMYFAGGGSVGQLANKSVKYAFGDELDKHRINRKEAPSFQLLRSRVKNVADSKIMVFCSPTTQGGQINQEYKTGTQHVLEVPCPHCGAYQELKLKNLRFDHCHKLDAEGRPIENLWDLERVEREAYFVCPHCRAKIEQSEKAKMMSRIRARQTNFGLGKDKLQLKKFSLHISDFYSPFVSWGVLAREYIESLVSAVDFKNFCNNRLGEAPEEKVSNYDVDALMTLCGDYGTNILPKTPYIAPNGAPAIFIAADKQLEVVKWVRAAFCPGPYGADCYILDAGTTTGFDDLEFERNRTVYCAQDGKSYNAKIGCVDEGFNTMLVRDWCMANPAFVPMKGRGGVQVRAVVARSLAPHNGGNIEVYHFSDDDFKREVYIERIQKHLSEALDAPVKTPRIYFPATISTEFLHEHTTERLVRDFKAGRQVFKWEKRGGANDFGDTTKLAHVLWHVVRDVFMQTQTELKIDNSQTV